MRPMLDGLLRDRALEHGPGTALVHGDTRLTYAALDRPASRMAAGVRLPGLRPGRRLLVHLPNVPEYVIILFALLRAGAVPVICPLAYREPQVARVVQADQPGYVGPAVHQGFDHTATAARIAARAPFLRRVLTLEAAPGRRTRTAGPPPTRRDANASPLGAVDAPRAGAARAAGPVAFLLPAPCGGDAAEPLLGRHAHDGCAVRLRAAAEAAELSAADVYPAALPAGSGAARGGPGILGRLSAGGTAVLPDDPGPAVCLWAAARERVAVAALPPDTARRRLGAPPPPGPVPAACGSSGPAGDPWTRRPRSGSGGSRGSASGRSPTSRKGCSPPSLPDACQAPAGRPVPGRVHP
ncbi:MULTISPECIES: AMP-binding protein [Streptomyces]|uniref:AMP-binding protein n=1 Tax=Streptomyces TaxID=1883 RepID=UPI0016744306|nr:MULTISPECIES: AMP-binding protein [Streptomyces]MBD3579445.1 AMP-binding protein [Streptomyces sp. KD18]GGT22699.1 hypothetical protein GCM10010286_55120 [Streptomyces toxytricini]